MPLEDEIRKKLLLILTDCCALVRGVGGKSQGSGFFIDEDLLLTCAHVVKGKEGDQVEVKPVGRQLRKGTILRVLDGDTADLALVRVDRVEGEPPLDAAVLDKRIDNNIDYYAIGFPVEAKASSGHQEIKYQGHAHKDDSTPSLLILQAGGALVSPGLSGGAVMSAESGAVVAIVQYRKDRSIPAGGGAIPIHRATEMLEEVRVLHDKPRVATNRWREALGRDAWSRLGKPWDWREQLNIAIKGDTNSWEIGFGEGAYGLTAKELPDNVSQALFHWARRRRVRDEKDVELLGRLLGAALFPPEVMKYVIGGAKNDQTLVRLTFEPESELFDVPWEFAAIDINGKPSYVAAEPKMGLVRVGSHRNEDLVDIAPRDLGTVLGIVADPEDWAKHPSGSRSADWLALSLNKAVKFCPSLELVPLTNAPGTKVEKQVEKQVELPDRQPRVEIVHYVGFGQYEGGSRAQLLFADSDGETDWTDVAKVFGWVDQVGARLLVVELLQPRPEIDLEPIPPKIFQDALSNRLNAVVYTRMPVQPKLSNVFNEAFYTALGLGMTVEAAMQSARKSSRSTNDAAGFGWFSLLTGPKADTRLLHASARPEPTPGRGQSSIPREDQPGAGRAEQPASQDQWG